MPFDKSDAETPNIIFIHAESMDGRVMGCMGHPAMQGATPNLDSLAQRGTLFREAYSNNPVCCPSRASMWSGKYPNYYDCWNNHEGLKEDVPVFQDVFDRAGYRTSAFGGLDYRWGKHSIRDRVGSWTRTAKIHRPINKMLMPVIVDDQPHPGDWEKSYQAVSEMREAARDKRPFMLYMTTGLVHPMFVTNNHYLNKIDEGKIRIPPGLKDVSEEKHPVDRYTRTTKNHERAMPTELVRQIRHIYFAMVAELDCVVGRVLDAVEKLGLSDSTYIIFSSDHGEMAGEHNQILKRTMYEPSIHVPMIISGPDVRQNAVVDTPVSLIDIYPTLMDMARLEYSDYADESVYPESLDGESLMPQLTDGRERERDWAFAEWHGDRCCTGSYMLRRDRWKLIHHIGYEPQLFDLAKDQWEMNNLASSEPGVVKELTGVLTDNFDCEGIDKRARKYDRECFRKWRAEQKKRGTYGEEMSRIYSGYSRLCLNDIVPWREQDEKIIEDWLGE